MNTEVAQSLDDAGIPYYREIGHECALFETAFQQRLPLLLKGPTGCGKTLLAQTQGITRLRGKWFEFGTPRLAAPIPAMALYHPAYLLRSPAMKRDAWRDLLMLKAKLAEAAEV